jgi:hypothetical protein
MTGCEQSAAGWGEGGPCSCAYREIDSGVKPRNALGLKGFGAIIVLCASTREDK